MHFKYMGKQLKFILYNAVVIKYTWRKTTCPINKQGTTPTPQRRCTNAQDLNN
jgi:hypothetical protein